MLTSANIRGKSFDFVKNGYDPDEVRSFLDEIANEYSKAILSKENNESKINELNAKIEEYRNDEDAIKNALILSQKESNRIITEAKTQADEMIELAKTEQARLTEQSAAECEKIINDHKENCAKLIKENTEATEKKISEIRINHYEEKKVYEDLKKEVKEFKAHLLEMYRHQLNLIMGIPDVEPEVVEKPEELKEKELEEAKQEEVKEETTDNEISEENKDDLSEKNVVTEEKQIDKILSTGSFEPVIPKNNLSDLKFGKKID